MLNQIATKMADNLLRHQVKSNRQILIYGLELLISNFSAILSVMVIATAMKSTLSGLVYLSFYIPIRVFSGGYHAKTYLNGFLLTNSLFGAVLLISTIVPTFIHAPASSILALVSCTIILFRAPLIHRNNPTTQEKFLRYKKTCRVITTSEFTLLFFGNIINKTSDFAYLSFVAALSTCIVALLIVIYKKEEYLCFGKLSRPLSNLLPQ